jgi:hypothetical protein
MDGKAPSPFGVLPQQVGEGLVTVFFPNLLGEYPEGGRGPFLSKSHYHFLSCGDYEFIE